MARISKVASSSSSPGPLPPSETCGVLVGTSSEGSEESPLVAGLSVAGLSAVEEEVVELLLPKIELAGFAEPKMLDPSAGLVAPKMLGAAVVVVAGLLAAKSPLLAPANFTPLSGDQVLSAGWLKNDDLAGGVSPGLGLLMRPKRPPVFAGVAAVSSSSPLSRLSSGIVEASTGGNIVAHLFPVAGGAGWSKTLPITLVNKLFLQPLSSNTTNLLPSSPLAAPSASRAHWQLLQVVETQKQALQPV